jgi:glutamate decarboxylase
VIRKIARFVGPAFLESEEGLLVPGGSIGNLYAMHLARERSDPQMATRGCKGSQRLVLFVSQDAHYSYLKSARLVGIGTDNVVAVGVREPDGGMSPLLLREAISREKRRGGTPFMVGATAGTTVRGAFDPLEEIARICASEENLWLHVDAAWGGAALFSERHRGHLRGVHLADSFSWSLHKLLGVALQCAVFLTKHRGSLERANATRAAYLFQKDKLHADLDIGDRTIQCGRKPDALKAWLFFKSMGDAGCAASVDHAFGLAEYAAHQIRTSDAFTLTYAPSCTNVCFWFLPTNMRGSKSSSSNGHKRRSSALHRVAPRIKAILQTSGAAMIGFQSVDGRGGRWSYSPFIFDLFSCYFSLFCLLF